MFNKVCANCGRLEIFHIDSDFLERCMKNRLWPDYGYQDDPNIFLSDSDLSDVDKAIEILYQHQKGYYFPLDKCPGFKYRKCDKKDLIEYVIEMRPSMIECLPEEWKVSVDKKLKKLMADEESKDDYINWLPTSIHIFYEPNTGRSYVVRSD